MRYLLVIFSCFHLLFAMEAAGQGGILPYTNIDLDNLEAFESVSSNWQLVEDVFFDLNNQKKIQTTPGKGVLLNRVNNDSNGHLVTRLEHGDLEIELDFMMAKGSNAGVYLQGRYEIQMFDSWGVADPRFLDAGGIYQRWDETREEGRKGFEGHAPLMNTSKAPGLWQQLKIRFRAPRFDDLGNKIENARFVEVYQNSVLVQKNIEVTGPTRAALFANEKALGPLMIQGDHGTVAIRNIRYKTYGSENVSLSGMKLTAYDSITSLKDFVPEPPQSQMDIDVLAHLAPASRNQFAGIIEGNIHVPETGEYHFNLDLAWIPNETNPDRINGGGELQIKNTKVLMLDGKSSSAPGAISLEAGSHPFKLSYYKSFGFWYARSNDITLAVEGPQVAYTVLHAPLRAADPVGDIFVRVEDETKMQRGFFNHQESRRTHVIAVGEPGTVSYAVDLGTGGLLGIWRGDFLETTPMWYGRGETQLMNPLGSVIEFDGSPSLTSLSDEQEPWPKEYPSYHYDGYDVVQGKPVFRYSFEETIVKDFIESEDEGRRLTRTIAVEEKNGLPQWCKLAEGVLIERMPNGLYAINDKQYFIQIEGKEKPTLRSSSGKMELLLPIDMKDKKGKVKYSIVW